MIPSVIEYLNDEDAKALWDAAVAAANERTEDADLDTSSHGVAWVCIKCTSSIGRWALLSKLMKRDKVWVTLRLTVANKYAMSFETAAFWADCLASELGIRGVEAWSDSTVI